MAYNVTFGLTQKKVNSTSQLYITRATAICNLKTPCDILAPVFTFQGDFPENANYMYVSEWSKYFWITSKTFREGRWEISGRIDALATYKTMIGMSTQFVVRSASAWNGLIADTKCTALSTVSADRTIIDIGMNPSGTYIIGVAGNTGTMYYACTKAQFDQLYRGVFSNSFLESLIAQFANCADSVNAQRTEQQLNPVDMVLYNSLVDPGQYIQSAIWIPFSVGGDDAFINAGITTIGAGKPVGAGQLVYQYNGSIALPLHPQTAALGGWVNGNRGRRATIYAPGVGTATIDMSSCPESIFVGYSVDITGGVTFLARVGGQTIIRTGNVGVQVGLAEIKTDIGGAINSIVSAGAGFAAENPSMFLKGVMDGTKALLPTVDTIATGSGRAIAASTPFIVLDTQTVTFQPDNATTQGKPLCQARTINTLSGYIECDNASLELPGASYDEITEVNGYLNGGFYFE